MPNKHKYPTIRLKSSVCDRLSEVTGTAVSINLERYFWLLDATKIPFSEAQWNLLRDACNGWATTMEAPETLAQGLAIQVEDSIDFNQLDQKWRVDGKELVNALKVLKPIQSIAVIEAIECYWRSHAEQMRRSLKSSLLERQAIDSDR